MSLHLSNGVGATMSPRAKGWLVALACVALFLCIEPPRWGSRLVLGTLSPGYTLVSPEGPFWIYAKTPDGVEHMFEVPEWELSRFRSDVPFWLDVRQGVATIHRPFGDWYYRTYLWMRWSAKQWFTSDAKKLP